MKEDACYLVCNSKQSEQLILQIVQSEQLILLIPQTDLALLRTNERLHRYTPSLTALSHHRGVLFMERDPTITTHRTSLCS